MKKRVLALFLVMAVAVTMFAFPASASSSDKWAGWTRISTPEDLRLMDNSGKRGSFYLVNDIDMKNYGSWTPISSTFYGVLDGNGFAIRNLTGTGGGLFSWLSGATVKNLGLVNANVVRSGDIGALSNGYTGTVNVENCYVTGTVDSTSGFVGGFVGGCITGNITFKNCINRAAVTSNAGAGGILGNSVWDWRTNGSATFINCVNAGAVTGDSPSVGGIVGRLSPGCLIENTYNYGTIKSANTSNEVHTVGGLVGSTSGSVIRNCATIGKNAIGTDSNSTISAKTNVPRDDFKKQETYKGFNFDRIWYINPEVNNGFPILRTMMRLYEIPDGSGNSNSGTGKAATGVRVIINVKEGDTLQLGALLNPADSIDTVTYSSNKTSVASVNSSGLVTAKAKGTADITVTAGKVKQTVRVRVT